MGIDYSFIRFKPSFLEAKNVGDPRVSTHNYHNIIQLLPTEAYLQISNADNGIAFDEDYEVKIVDCADTELADITDYFYISEFIDKNGINQIAFEILPLNLNFYQKPVYFKIIHTTGDDVYWSNPLVITDDREEETTRFDYKSYGYFKNIDYERADFMQSIRLRTYFDRPIDETEVKDYYQITRGKEISTRALLNEKEAYLMDYVIPFVFSRMNVLLIHDVIYIDGVRMTNKTTLKSNERLGQSNLMETDFVVSKNYDDTYVFQYQIFEPLELVGKIPTGAQSAVYYQLNYILRGTFNRSITKTTGTVNIYKAIDDSLVVSFDENDITVTDNEFTASFEDLIVDVGDYYVQISDGLFISNVDSFAGISNKTDWTFSLVVGDWLSTDWDDNDFLIF